MPPLSLNHGVLAEAIHRMHMHTCRGEGHTHLDLTRILTCVWLWDVPLVCTFLTFSPLTVPLLKGLFWSLNSLAEQWTPLCPFSNCMKGRWLAACSLLLLQDRNSRGASTYPACQFPMAPHLKGTLKGQQHIFYLGTHLYWHSPTLTPSGQELLCGALCSSLSRQVPCKIA